VKRRANPFGRLAIEILWEMVCLVAIAFIAVAVVIDRMRNREC
jgi:hypothetical protein